MDYQSIVTFVMEMAGSVAFAASGAMVGVERNMDIFGVSVLGVATAVGGGMIRDIVLGIIPPAVFTNPVYALVSVLASCIVFFIFFSRENCFRGTGIDMFYKNIRRYTRHHISKQTAAYSRYGSKKYKQEHIVHISLADSCIYSYYCKNPKPDRVYCQHCFLGL